MVLIWCLSGRLITVISNANVAPVRILKFPVILPYKFLDAENFNMWFSAASGIAEIADKLGISLGGFKQWEL